MPRCCSSLKLTRSLGLRALPLALAATLAAWLAPAAAQTVIGGSGRPEVEVNQDVLESLGPQPTLPDLLLGRRPHGNAALVAPHAKKTAAGQLHPPKKKQTKTAALAKKAPAPKQSAQATPAAAPATQATAASAPRESVAATPLAETPAAPAATATPAAAAPAASAAAPTALAPAITPATEATATAATAPATSATVSVATPPVSPPSPAPTLPPSPAAEVAMATPPSVATTVPAATPVTPVAAPAALDAAKGVGARVLFTAGSSDLPDAAKQSLAAIVQQLKADDQSRLQLIAYASGTADEANQARRLSLTRALAVRTYLMEQGVRNARIDVRALGNRSDGSAPPDRVDVVIVDR